MIFFASKFTKPSILSIMADSVRSIERCFEKDITKKRSQIMKRIISRLAPLTKKRKDRAFFHHSIEIGSLSTLD